VQTSIRVITIKENGCKRHVCEKCKFTSLHRSNIVRHIYRVHEQYREQECPACNYKVRAHKVRRDPNPARFVFLCMARAWRTNG
jgi:hypothetical protein